jgi:intracellular septation protein
VAFTLIEAWQGILAGLVAGMLFGLAELLWERLSTGRASGLTVGSTLLVLGLGGVALLTQEGIWFKLQPALMEAALALACWGSWLGGRPLLLELARKQGALDRPGLAPGARPVLERALSGMTLRAGGFLFLQAVLTTWAAFRWSTAAWALLKGVGFGVSFVAYLAIETLATRRRVRRLLRGETRS